MKNYIKQNKTAIIKYSAIVLTAFTLGVMAHNPLSRAKHNVQDMVFNKPVVYVAVDKEQEAKDAIRTRAETVNVFNQYVNWIYEREQSDKFRKDYEKYNAQAVVSFGRLTGGMQETIEGYKEVVVTGKKK